ncbi:MAG: FtsQ-type POTRA domain-containing protein [Actinomycetota bacterium]|nr:FtsQ-type POTRA domain-containing protein [Actinomycetota bacterium]
MTRSGGASWESQDDAAGSSPTSDANAVYVGRVVPVGAVRAPGKSRGSRPWWRAAFFALALAGVVAVASWALLGSRLLVVRSVVVTGTHLVPATEVLAVAGVARGTPLIRVNPGQVAARVETIPQVRSAQVTRSWPDRVRIVIWERIPALAVPAPVKGGGEVGGGFDLVDPDGVVVRWAQARPPGLPLYPAPGAVASLRGDPDLVAAAAVLGELPAQLRRTVKSVTAPSPAQVTLQLPGEITVLWGGPGDAASKARELAVLEQTHSHYYDVSAAGTLMTN